MPRPAVELSRDDARRLALRSQGFAGRPDLRAGAGGVLRALGAVQLDTISVLARSHELVAYARLGAIERSAVERAYWSRPAVAFEYWAHAASILPIEDWPWYAMRRARHARALTGPPEPRRAVLARLEEDGPLTARELGGARLGGPWWDWSPLKRAAEELLAAGDVVCVERRGWQRVYDLAERAIPPSLREQRPTDDECKVELARRAARALGVGTLADIADYHRQGMSRLRAVVADAGLVPVAVDGWDDPAWACPLALEEAGASGRGRRETLLSPFDSLIWSRARTERIFALRHRLEAYVPASKRTHGYFAMPVLAGGRLVARVDPVRRDGSLVARTVTMERPSAAGAVVRATLEAARWVGCDTVMIERVVPSECEAPLRAALHAVTRAR